MRILPDVDGYSTVFLPGHSASFIVKTSTSLPHIIRLRGQLVRGMSSFDDKSFGCERGFVYVDSMVTFPLNRPKFLLLISPGRASFECVNSPVKQGSTTRGR